MKKILFRLFSYVASMIPTTKIILFHSFPEYSDNPYAFCQYLITKDIDKVYKFIWLYDDVQSKDNIRRRMLKDGLRPFLIYRRSILGVWYYIRARYIIVSHGCFDAIKLYQHDDKVINLWHGMPLKLLGASEKGGCPSSSNINYIVASSKQYKKIMAEAFACPERKVLVIGQPRCDMLFQSTDWFENMGIDTSKYEKIGMWMPTYRKSIVGDIRVDGEYVDKGIAFLTEHELHKLDDFLGIQKTLILIKIHPMDALQRERFDEYCNIIFIKPQEFNSPLYPLLGSCDFLLTDYSSVFIDYQILGRPIGFVMNDVEKYRNSRGFYFEDLENSLPGPILPDMKSLCDFIVTPYIKECNVKYNDFFDNKASERLAKFLKLIQ